jgi:hypothetical protein
VDLVFSLIFTVLVGVHVLMTFRTFQINELQTILTQAEHLSTVACLLVHIGCLTYNTLVEHNADFNQLTLESYMFFQLTYDLLNIALISKFFQWLEVSYTIHHTIQIKERTKNTHNSSFLFLSNAKKISRGESHDEPNPQILFYNQATFNDAARNDYHGFEGGESDRESSVVESSASWNT